MSEQTLDTLSNAPNSQAKGSSVGIEKSCGEWGSKFQTIAPLVRAYGTSQVKRNDLANSPKADESRVKNAPAELQPFQGEKEVFTNLTGFQAAKTPSKWVVRAAMWKHRKLSLRGPPSQKVFLPLCANNLDILDITRTRRVSSVSIVVCFSSAEVRVHAPAPTQPHGHVLVCRYTDADAGTTLSLTAALDKSRHGSCQPLQHLAPQLSPFHSRPALM
ncbi:uncharacterized protein [Clinocottus analis]|uniref:uncharacterized protein n=1 Tax=Clinocottus analis TaxID=304258 RepID=UPI0035C10D63